MTKSSYQELGQGSLSSHFSCQLVAKLQFLIVLFCEGNSVRIRECFVQIYLTRQRQLPEASIRGGQEDHPAPIICLPRWDPRLLLTFHFGVLNTYRPRRWQCENLPHIQARLNFFLLTTHAGKVAKAVDPESQTRFSRLRLCLSPAPTVGDGSPWGHFGFSSAFPEKQLGPGVKGTLSICLS